MDNAVKHNVGKNRFYIAGDEGEKGALTYSIENNVMIMSSTYVDPQYRGHQYARKLVDAGVKFAKEQQIKINPTCSYALKVIERDYPDLMA